MSVVFVCAAAGGASAKMMTQAQAMKQIQDVLGTWTCKSSEGTHSATFTSILAGKRIERVTTRKREAQ
jgi:hypothetical protein